MVALSTPNRDHVPYRQSRLTYLLKDSIGGNCKTTMIANVWGEFSGPRSLSLLGLEFLNVKKASELILYVM